MTELLCWERLLWLTAFIVPLYCHIPCLKWELSKNVLVLKCQLHDLSSTVVFKDQYGTIRGQCNLTKHCSSIIVNAINTQATLTLQINNRTLVDGTWTCIHGNETYTAKITRISGKIKQSELEITGNIIRQTMKKTWVKITCSTCKKPFTNSIEYYTNEQIVDTLYYFPATNICKNRSGKCLSGACSCSDKGHTFSRLFEIGSSESRMSLSCALNLKDSSGSFYRESSIMYNGNGFTKAETKDLVWERPTLPTSSNNSLLVLLIVGSVSITIVILVAMWKCKNDKFGSNDHRYDRIDVKCH